GLSRGVLRYLERLVGHDLALQRQSELRTTIFAVLAERTWVGRRGGDLLSRVVHDVTVVSERVVRVTIPLAAAAVVVLGTGLVITWLSPVVGMLLLATAVLGAVVVPWGAARAAATSDRALAPLRGRLAAVVAEAASAGPDIYAYQAAPQVVARVHQVDDELRRAEQRSAAVAGLAGALQWLTTGGAVIGALLLGAHAVVAGDLPAVQLAVLALTPLALHEVVASLPSAAQARTRVMVAQERIDGLLAEGGWVSEQPLTDRSCETAEEWPAVTEHDGAIEVTGLTAGWPGGAPVVEGLDLCVRRGERVALTGASGSGKTTVAATLLGLIPPLAGVVEVTGEVDYLAQEAHLFDTTVAENLRIGMRDADGDRILQALSRVRLDLDPERLVGEHGGAVSGGEARRIALARLLLRDSPVMIVDEPTEHLDRPTADALIDDLFAATADRAVLVITHDPALMARCDRIVSLDREANGPSTSSPRPGTALQRTGPRMGALASR
ncbi:MAG: thiol reductant ABC exporter subunit CydC, partial [Propionibacteriaceae bacterium]